jgi:hypothetical protein
VSNPNEHTGWAAQEGPGEASLDLKDPISENDPNVGTRWGDPVDRSKPRVRVAREIDKYIDRPVETCKECGFESLTENGMKTHKTPGADGMSPCARDKARFKPVKDCKTCGGTGRGAGQCPSCSGSGDGKFEAKCRGCNGKGVLRAGSDEPCNVKGCNGGTRQYCAECSGSGEITHCGACRGSGKVAIDSEVPPQAAAPVDTDALAAKITEGISKTLNDGFAMLAGVLQGKAPKVTKRKEKAPRGSSARVRRGAPTGGSESVPDVGQPDAAVENPSSESPKAE